MSKALISPEWNVNIVEVIELIKRCIALISPEWNVNETMDLKNMTYDRALISPEWNVNHSALISEHTLLML